MHPIKEAKNPKYAIYNGDIAGIVIDNHKVTWYHNGVVTMQQDIWEEDINKEFWPAICVVSVCKISIIPHWKPES